MTSPNRQTSPPTPCPALESSDHTLTEQAHLSATGPVDELSYDQRVAAATEAVRQIEAHFAGNTTR